MDLKNYVVDLLVKEFEIKKITNLEFFYLIVKDNHGHLKHIFWTDRIFIEKYKLFGDIVKF